MNTIHLLWLYLNKADNGTDKSVDVKNDNLSTACLEAMLPVSMCAFDEN